MTTWYVRKTGSDTNGGTSASQLISRTNGVTNGTNTLTSTTGGFTNALIGHGICIVVSGNGQYRFVTAINSATSLEFSGATIASGTGRTFRIGGAFNSLRRVMSADLSTGVLIPLAGGDQVWVGAGRYRDGNAINADQTPSSVVTITGDIDGSHTGDSGEIVYTTRSSDFSAPTPGGRLMVLYSPNWTIENMTMEASDVVIDASTLSGSAANHTLRNCNIYNCFQTSESKGYFSPDIDWPYPSNILIENCRFFTVGRGIQINLNAGSTGADVDANFVVRNCVLVSLSDYPILISSDTNTYHMGGVKIENCLLMSKDYGVYVVGTLSSSIPSTIYNNRIYGGIHSEFYDGSVIEDYNWFAPYTTVYDNVDAGLNSQSDGTYNDRFSFGQEAGYGMRTRPFGTPASLQPTLTMLDPSSTVTTDMLGVPKGSGGNTTGKAIGPYERPNTWVKETSTVRTGSTAISCTGAAIQDFDVEVDAVQTTLSIYMRYNSTYGTGTSKPIFQIINGSECGVSDQSLAMTAAANTWEKLSITFTPTSQGIITVRLNSRDTTATGKTFADDRNW